MKHTMLKTVDFAETRMIQKMADFSGTGNTENTLTLLKHTQYWRRLTLQKHTWYRKWPTLLKNIQTVNFAEVNSGEENSNTAPAGIQTCDLSITSPALLPTSYPSRLQMDEISWIWSTESRECLFCLLSLYMEWPSPSSSKETLSGLLQIWPKNISSSKTIDPLCFPSFALLSPSIVNPRLYTKFVLKIVYCVLVCAVPVGVHEWVCVCVCVCVCAKNGPVGQDLAWHKHFN